MARRTILAFLFAVALFAVPGVTPAQRAPSDPGLVVHAGVLIDRPGETPKREHTLVVRDGKIIAVRPGYVSPEAAGQPQARLLDMRAATVLPGLIDTHVHLATEDPYAPDRRLRQASQSDPTLTLLAARNAEQTLLAGFTTVRDLGSPGVVAFALRDAVQAQTVRGPRILASGEVVSVTGGRGDLFGYRAEVDAVLAPPTLCDGADDCRRAVRAAIRRGADVIKVAATGGIVSESPVGAAAQISDSELAAIVETAHALGRRVAVHAHGADGVRAALAAGADSIEHGTYASAEMFARMRAEDVYFVPTLSAAEATVDYVTGHDYIAAPIRARAEGLRPQVLQAIALARKARVKIAFGTDSGIGAHGKNALEFDLLVRAGLSPTEALVTATRHAAELLGIEDIVGTLESGKRADFIAVLGDPLQSPAPLHDVRVVVQDGVVRKSKSLEEKLP